MSEEIKEDIEISGDIGEPIKFKIFLNNPAKIPAELEAPVLPSFLNIKHKLQHFPLTIPANTSLPLELTYNPKSLQK